MLKIVVVSLSPIDMVEFCTRKVTELVTSNDTEVVRIKPLETLFEVGL